MGSPPDRRRPAATKRSAAAASSWKRSACQCSSLERVTLDLGLRKAVQIATCVVSFADCDARPAASDRPSRAPEAAASGERGRAADAGAAALATSGPHALSNGVTPAFSTATWLENHGVTAWTHDPSCWWKAPGHSATAEWINDCSCERELVLALAASGRVELLVCKRGQELREARLRPLQRTVLYAARKGAMRVVLDVPTAAAIDGEAFGLYGAPGVGVPPAPVGNVSLLVTSVEASVVVSNDESGVGGAVSCAQALATAEREKLDDVRRVYAKVCASIGVWRWVEGRLVRQPGQQPP